MYACSCLHVYIIQTYTYIHIYIYIYICACIPNPGSRALPPPCPHRRPLHPGCKRRGESDSFRAAPGCSPHPILATISSFRKSPGLENGSSHRLWADQGRHSQNSRSFGQVKFAIPLFSQGFAPSPFTRIDKQSLIPGSCSVKTGMTNCSKHK